MSVFITSTGTEIGKTFVTACLVHQLRAAGQKVQAIKPVISGIDSEDMAGTDTAILAEAMGLPATCESWDRISPLRYRAPLAPSMAARAEGRTLDYDMLLHLSKTAMAGDGFCFIEGVGGSFVPLVGDTLVADWIADLKVPSVLVAGSYLGTISHTVATVEAMRARGLEILGIIVSESAGEHPDLYETKQEIAQITGLDTLALPRVEGKRGWAQAPDLTTLLP